MNKTTVDRNWNERYLAGDTPWAAHGLLTAVIDLIKVSCPNEASIFEIGCGYGQEAIALAKLGFNVTAVDLSSAAINQAKINSQEKNVNIHFEAFDLLHDKNHFSPVDLVLDIAVLHTIENEATRLKFTQAVFSLLKPGATWINVSCLSPDVFKISETTGVKAPPALSKTELQEMSKNNFFIQKQIVTSYEISRDGKLVEFPALISVMKKFP